MIKKSRNPFDLDESSIDLGGDIEVKRVELKRVADNQPNGINTAPTLAPPVPHAIGRNPSTLSPLLKVSSRTEKKRDVRKFNSRKLLRK